MPGVRRPIASMQYHSDMSDPQSGQVESELERLRDWKSFLEMLSVAHTQHFITDLALPIDHAHYSQAMRLARACLEVFMFPSVGKQIEPGYTWEFPKHWPIYRKQEGVLSDDDLERFSKQYQYLEDVLIPVFRHRRQRSVKASYYYIVPYVYTELYDWVGSETSDALEGWFEKYFRGPIHEFSDWPLIFSKVHKNYSENVVPVSPCPLTNSEWRVVEGFCSSYDEREASLSKRFEDISEAAVKIEPTPWEAVLQTFPVDSYARGGHVPRQIKDCVRFRLYLEEVEILKQKLGYEKATKLAKWALEEARQPPPHGLKLWL